MMNNLTNSFGGMPTQLLSDIDIKDKTNPTKGQTVVDDELVLTKVDSKKTSQTTKNGRYISRIMDAINKLNSRDGTTKDKNLFNLVMIWDIRQRLLIRGQFNNEEIYNKYIEMSSLLNKFDRDDDDYSGYLKYTINQLDIKISPTFNDLGIPHFNYLRENYQKPDIFGYTTYHNDIFLPYKDLDYSDQDNLSKLGNPEKFLPDFNLPDTVNQDVPKIIHLVYYKKEIDFQHFYVNLSTFTANRDFQIIIWVYKKPQQNLPIGEHVTCKEFSELDDFDSEDKYAKYLLKYKILKQYGGIYVDYSVYGQKKFDPESVSQNFMSVFVKNVSEVRYVCPLTLLMGFSADHPLVNYIIDNFDRGVKTCGTEFIYIRSALAKSGMSDIKLLYQDIMNEIHNKSYVILYNEKQAKDVKYFTLPDFDTKDKVEDKDEVDEGGSDDKPEIDDDGDMADLEKELEEIEGIASKIVEKHEPKGYTWPIWVAILAGLVWFWLENTK